MTNDANHLESNCVEEQVQQSLREPWWWLRWRDTPRQQLRGTLFVYTATCPDEKIQRERGFAADHEQVYAFVSFGPEVETDPREHVVEIVKALTSMRSFVETLERTLFEDEDSEPAARTYTHDEPCSVAHHSADADQQFLVETVRHDGIAAAYSSMSQEMHTAPEGARPDCFSKGTSQDHETDTSQPILRKKDETDTWVVALGPDHLVASHTLAACGCALFLGLEWDFRACRSRSDDDFRIMELFQEDLKSRVTWLAPRLGLQHKHACSAQCKDQARNRDSSWDVLLREWLPQAIPGGPRHPQAM
jgi:hypothetical protein